MTQDPMPRGELLAAIRESRNRTLEALRSMTAEQLAQGRYEAGWNGRQIVAHVASMEWTYPRLIDLARAAQTPSPDRPGGSAPAGGGFRNGNDEYNARQVEKRAQSTIEELIEEFERNRAATIEAVENVDQELLSATLSSAGGITGTLSSVFHALAVIHVRDHIADMLGEKD